MNSYRSEIKDIIRSFRILYILLRMLFCPKIQQPSGAIAIIAPHPDDEVLGCGGMIQRLTNQGIDVHVIVMTGGEVSHQNCCDISKDRLKDVRRGLCSEIDTNLGINKQHIHLLNYPDGGILTEHEETERLRSLIRDIKPNAIFVPHWGEGWPDHVNTRDIIRDITNKGTTLYEYCVWMWYYNVWRLDWRNAQVLRMTKEEHEKKLEAINNYVKPLAPCGKPWSGVLPPLLLKAARHHTELFFKIR